MTRIPIESFKSQASDGLSAAFGRNSPMPFVAFAAILIVVAYVSPFQYAWTQSLAADEDIDDVRPGIAAKEGSLQKQVALGVLGLIGLSVLANSSDRLLQVKGPIGWICVAYLLWCAASCVWADDFAISFRRVVGLWCEVLAGVAVAQRVSPRQFAWLVFTCTLSWLTLGILAEISLGTFQPWQSGYRFNGVFWPNIMAGNCLLLIVSSFYLSSVTPSKKWLMRAFGGFAVLFLVLTGSRTALATLTVLYGFFWFLKTSPTKKLVSAGSAIGLVVFSALCLLAVDELHVPAEWAALGRADHDTESLETLQGRVPLWEELLDVYACHRPLLGYGYGSFWTPNRIEDVAESQGWSPAYAHSTYIELLMSVGLIGAILFVAAIVPLLTRALRIDARYPAVGYGFIAMVLAVILIDGALETNFGATSFMSFFGICAVCYVLSADRETRHWSYAQAAIDRNK